MSFGGRRRDTIQLITGAIVSALKSKRGALGHLGISAKEADRLWS